MISAAFPVHRHALPQLVLDGALAALAYFLAFWVRFGGELHGRAHRYERLLDGSFWWVMLIVLASLAAFGQYQRLWKFVGQRDYEAVVKALVVATFVIVGLVALVHPVEYTPTRHGVPTGNTAALTLPISVIAPFFLLAVGLLVAARFAMQLITDGRVRSPTAGKNARQVLIVGGGEGGRLVVRELMRNPGLGLRPVGFLDDDPVKLGTKNEHGFKVLGRTTNPDLTRVLDEVEPDEVVIAIPSASGELRGRVVIACRKRGIPVRTTPTVFELLRDGSGQLQVTRQLREVRVEDILGREPVREQLEQVVRLSARSGRARHRCRRLDRVRALPADRPGRTSAADHGRPRRGQPVRDPARARGGPPRPHRRPRARRLQGGGADAGGARRAPARRRLPRRRLQARRR